MLSNPLRNQLIAALLDVPRIGSRNRRDELVSSLPPSLVDGLNRDDSARTDLNLIVGQLDRLGRLVATGERPLVIVAQAAMPYVEATDTGRKLADVIRALERHYGRGAPDTPVALLPVAPLATTETGIPEAIIFGDERVTYQFVDRALAVARSVARLMVPRLLGGEWVGPPALGTGWVVAPSLLVTNYHVVAARFGREAAATDDECRAQAARARAWFDYQVEGGPRDDRDAADLVCMSAVLDYAIVRLKNGAGREPLPVTQASPLLVKGDRLNIVQHPGGGPLKYAIRSNHYVSTAGPGQDHLLRYLTDTEGGASGAPVLDDSWRVVGLHRAAMPVPRQEHRGRVTYVNNEGIAIHAILKDLPATVRDEIAAAQGWKNDVAHA